MENRLSWWCFAVLLAAFAVIQLLPSNGLDPANESQRFLSPPPEYIEYFHFGFADSMADSFWLRWIQDNDTCQTYAGVAPATPIQPPQAGDFVNPRHKFCDFSWSFKMLDTVTKLSPRFRMPYANGAITLSVLVDDYEGAKVIFDRGVKNFPNDWDILYQASYHYLFDRHDMPAAASLLERAYKSGGPSWLPLFAARLYSKAGQMEMGIKTLERYRSNLKEEREIANVDERIRKLKQANQ